MGICGNTDKITCDRNALLQALWQVVDEFAGAVIAIYWLRHCHNGRPDGSGHPFIQYLCRLEDYKLREIVASSPGTPSDVLRQLAKDKNNDVRAAVAGNPNTPPEVLHRLAEDEDMSVRAAVAGNPNTPPQVLRFLVEDEDEGVRAAMARNPNTPSEVLRHLAKADKWWVRMAVAGNPNTPPEVLCQLAEDKPCEMRQAVAGNPNTPPEVLHHLAEDEVWNVRAAVAGNPNTPPEALRHLAEDKNEKVRAAVAGNPNTPPEALHHLVKDKNGDVRAAVASNTNVLIQLLRHLIKDEDGTVIKHAKQQIFAIAKRYCLNVRSQHPLTDAARNPINITCDMNLTCEDLALWLIHTPSHEATVDLPAYLLNRKGLLGAIVRLCRVPLPSLEDAQRHSLYKRSAKYRAAVAAIYTPKMTWFDAQVYAPHLFRPICLSQGHNSPSKAAYLFP